MTYIHQAITDLVNAYFIDNFGKSPAAKQIAINDTRDNFEGNYTLVTFPLAGMARMKPEELGETLGAYIVDKSPDFSAFNVVKGFLNLVCSAAFWQDEMKRQMALEQPIPQIGQDKIVLEYASPNSNKPLHLGHVRNILLGWSVGQLLKAVGNDVHYTQIVNDRGVAICKSMIAWEKFYDGATPETTGMKSDHFVGEAYVRFSKEFEAEYVAWQDTDAATELYQAKKKDTEEKEVFFKRYKNDYFNEASSLGTETRQMLLDWENGDDHVRALWKKLNSWFMDGFHVTANRLGISFDSMNFESDTYLLGKDIVAQGLEKGVFYTEDDGSVWIDLSDAGLDKKIVLRSDGTSVYITQDLGTAHVRYKELGMDGMIYTVGNEQNYHFQVLFEVLKRLGEPYADKLYHLSYGMVDLPSGKMKTREGTVVDADDLIDEVIEKVRENSRERGELDMLSADEKEEIFTTIGLGALKYYMLRVDAKKRMLFNPEESVDLQGVTGPYIQNAYVRIQSIKRRLQDEVGDDFSLYNEINEEEKAVIKTISEFGDEVVNAVEKYDPSVVATYAYNLAKTFHRFYHDHSIAHATTDAMKNFRYQLADMTAIRLQQAMSLLGITMPERM